MPLYRVLLDSIRDIEAVDEIEAVMTFIREIEADEPTAWEITEDELSE